MPTCLRTGWGQAGVWNAPIGEGQDRPFVASKKGLTPRHEATRAAYPRNTIGTGGLNMSCSPLSFKITLGGSSSAPSLSAWMSQEESIAGDAKASMSMSLTGKTIPATGPHMRAAGAGSVFFGDRPMWARSSDIRRKQSTYKASAGELRQSPISLRSPAEQALLEELTRNGTGPLPVKRGWEATPETLTPVSSRPASSAGSMGSGKYRNREPDSNAIPEPESRSGKSFATFMTPTMTSCSWKSHGQPNGEGVTDVALLPLPTRHTIGNPGVLDVILKNARRKGELYTA